MSPNWVVLPGDAVRRGAHRYRCRVSSVNRSRLTAALAAVMAAMLLVGCTPRRNSGFDEVGGADQLAAPVFPEAGVVPPELLIEGVVWELTNAPVDLDLWTVPKTAAQCAAEKIVSNHGSRLSDLGFEPGVTGAGLNDIALEISERTSIASLVKSCVDNVEAVAALFVGRNHMSPREALCMARGLDEQGQSGRFLDAWVYGAAVDPLEEDDDGALAQALLDYAGICLSGSVFDWGDSEMPGDGDPEADSDTEDTEDESGDTEGDPGSDLPGSAGNVTTTTEGRPTGG